MMRAIRLIACILAVVAAGCSTPQGATPAPSQSSPPHTSIQDEMCMAIETYAGQVAWLNPGLLPRERLSGVALEPFLDPLRDDFPDIVRSIRVMIAMIRTERELVLLLFADGEGCMLAHAHVDWSTYVRLRRAVKA
jgi:hypothetical protein